MTWPCAWTGPTAGVSRGRRALASTGVERGRGLGDADGHPRTASLHILLHRHLLRGVGRREHLEPPRARLLAEEPLLLLLPRRGLLLLLPRLRLPRRRLLVVLLLRRRRRLLLLLLLLLSGDDPVLQLEHLGSQPLEFHDPRLPPNFQLQLEHLLQVRLVQLLDVLVVGHLLGQFRHLMNSALTRTPDPPAAAVFTAVSMSPTAPEAPSPAVAGWTRSPESAPAYPACAALPAVVPTHHPVRVHGVVHAVRVVRRHPVRPAGVAPVRRRPPGDRPPPGPIGPGVPAGRAPRPVGRVRTPRGLVRVVVRLQSSGLSPSPSLSPSLSLSQSSRSTL